MLEWQEVVDHFVTPDGIEALTLSYVVPQECCRKSFDIKPITFGETM